MDLDKISDYGRLDSQGIIQNITEFPNQIEAAWNEVLSFALPTPYIQAQNVLLLGSGTNFAANKIISRFNNSKSVPIIVWNQLGLPFEVNSKTLVIASSYSGETLETIKNFEDAAKSGAKLLAITSGGTLAALCRKYRATCYTIHYGAHSRHTLGYSLTALYVFMQKLGFIEKNIDINETIALLKGFQQKIKPDVVLSKNLAKQIALRIQKSLVQIISSGRWAGVGLRFAQQLQENSKIMALPIPINEYIHTELNSLNFSSKMINKYVYIFLQSHYDNSQSRQQQLALIQFFERKGITHEEIFIQPSGGIFSEITQLLMMCDYISYYAAILNDVDPNDQSNRDSFNDIYISMR